jgi:hypothetical protein
MAARYLEMTRSGSPMSTRRPLSSHRTRSPTAFTSAVAWETNRMVTPRARKFVDLAHAALAKVNVADGQRFIHQQDFGIDIDGHGEGQPHHHPAGVGFHRLIDEVADLREGLDIAVALVDLAGGEPRIEPLR